MKNLVLKMFILLALPLGIRAQSTVLQSDDGPDETGANLKVLVIPFHKVRYYFSDCDKQIAQRNRLELPDVRQSFQLGLDYATENRLDKHHEPMNLVQMKDSVDKATLEKFYDNVSYSYETPSRIMNKKQAAVMEKVRSSFKQVGGESAPAKSHKQKKVKLGDAEQYSTVDATDEQYMRLNWTKPEFLSQLNTIYEPDYIVTINQFEIKTDLEKCIDRELGKYARTIKVHYNVFKPSGEQVYGDVVTAHYNSTSDDINAIIQDNFGILSEYILQSLPGRK
jgi:hypothetical protein